MKPGRSKLDLAIGGQLDIFPTQALETYWCLDGANGNAPLRHGARLGLAEALLAEGKVREAQIQFAQVSAIDHTDRDRVARALVGLAQCSLKLSDKNANQKAKRSLETVRDHYGDTPSVLQAQVLLQTL